MRYFGVLIGKNSPVSNKLIRRAINITQIARKAIGTGAPPLEWRSTSGRVVLIAWGDDAMIGLYRGELILQEGPHALAGAGYYYDSGYAADRDLLKAIARSTAADEIIAGLGGVFSLCHCDGARDQVRIWNTLASYPNIVYSETKDLIVASTRGLFVNMTVHGQPSYNYAAFGPFVVTDTFATDDLPYLAAKDMPPNTRLSASPAGLSISFIDDAYATFGHGDQPAQEKNYDQACQVLVESLSALVGTGVRTQLSLSGGKDSRVLAAGLHHIRANPVVSFFDSWSDHPDLVLGRRVAEILGFEVLPHRVLDEDLHESVARIRVDEWMVQTLRCNDGLHADPMVTPWLSGRAAAWAVNSYSTDSVACSSQASAVDIVGVGGEVIRGGYARKDSSYCYGYAKLDDANVKEIFRKIMVGKDWLLTQPVRTAYAEWLDDYFETEFSSKYQMAILERLYLFVSQARRLNPITLQYAFDPLLDNRLLRLVSRFDIASRRDELWSFELIRRLAPSLETVPLANNRWGFEFSGPNESAEADYGQRSPLNMIWGTRPTNYVSFTAMTDLRSFFEDSLLRKYRDYLSMFLDGKALERLIRSRDSYDYASANLFWIAHAAGLMLSNKWLEKIEQGPTGEAIEVRLDAPWNQICRAIADAIDSALIALHRSLDTKELNGQTNQHLTNSWPTGLDIDTLQDEQI